MLRKSGGWSSNPASTTGGGLITRQDTLLSAGDRGDDSRSFDDTFSIPGDTDSLISEDVEADMIESIVVANPSLSDRTVQTLSHVPLSPAVRGRRSFMKSDLDIENTQDQSPAKISSLIQGLGAGDGKKAMPNGRRDSQASIYSTSSRGLGTPSTRSTSTDDTLANMSKLEKKSAMGLDKRQPSAGAKSNRRAETLPTRGATFTESRGFASRSTKPRSSLTGAFVPPSPNGNAAHCPLSASKRTLPFSRRSSNVTSPISSISKTRTNISSGSDAPVHEQVESKPRKVSKSSTTLRETIAKAKAARKAARESSSGVDTFDPWTNLEESVIFNRQPKEMNQDILRKRIDLGRTTGLLNIAALGLKEIPGEVLNMYELDPDSSIEWYESVDLVKLIAADNEIEELPSTAFPDINPDDLCFEDDTKGNQFGGLEVLDLHGNMLRSLPIGLRRLQRLHTLNLSNNKLTMSGIEVISEFSGLVELKIANNSLEGPLSVNLGALSRVEVLDLHGNNLTDLPHGIADMICLKTLNISENSLTKVPFAALAGLPITELNASRNRLSGCLIPASVQHMMSLQYLNVVNNTLDHLSENDDVEFPNLQTLAVDGNRLKSLPALTSWRSLQRLSAEGNCIRELPDGFVTLESLRHVDLTANDLSRLDEKIGLMSNLISLSVANNPLRDRKFLTMDTEDLKRDLRNRCAPMLTDTHLNEGKDREPGVLEEDDEEGSVTTEFTLAPESPSHLNRWKVKAGGVLDRSSTDMLELEVEEVQPLLSTYSIKCLYIHHNKLQMFPAPGLKLLAHTLTDLDISNNPLKDIFVQTTISLPNLQNLTIKSSKIKSLTPLLENLSAPALKFLDISNNSLAGSLPIIRNIYHDLLTLLAADNQLSSLDFEAVRGLQALDITNNDIDFIPPKIGLLGVDGPHTCLRRFEIAGNKFRVPRWQIIEKGSQAVLEWLRGRIPANELEEWDLERQATLVQIE